MTVLTPASVLLNGQPVDKALLIQLLNAIIGGTASIGDFRGAWNSATAYIQRDIVQSGGSLWWALVGNTNVTPVEGATWTELLPGVTVADSAITEPKLASSLSLTLAPTVASLAALRGLNTSRYTTAYLHAGLNQGMFAWTGGDLSATLTPTAITSTSVASSTMTKTAHGLRTGDAVYLASTVNGLAAGLHYAIRMTADTFRLATSYANARAGTNETLSGTTNFTVKTHIDPLQGIYVIPTGGAIDGSAGAWVRQWPGRDLDVMWFGAAADWTYAGGDAGATDDAHPLQAALNFAGQVFAGGPDLGGGQGCQVLLPAQKTMMVGRRTVVPSGVRLKGQGVFASIIKMADAMSTSFHFIELGDSDAHLAGFGCALEDLQLFSGLETTGIPNIAMVYSNCAQHTGGVNRVKIFAGSRVGLFLETGYGGASTVTMDDVEIFNKFSFSGNAGAILNYAGALTMIGRRWVVQGPDASVASSVGVEIKGGLVVLEGYHTEGIQTGILVNIRTSNDQGIALIRGATGGSGITSVIKVDSLATSGVLNAAGIMPNGATYAIKNERSGGSNTTGNVNGTVTI